MTDSLDGSDGKPFRSEPPHGEDLAFRNFIPGDNSHLPRTCPESEPETNVAISATSSRLEHLAPFDSPFLSAAETGRYELPTMRCLLRIRGKCTSDHISAAGPWLKYKGHLSNLAENTLMGAANDETGNINDALDYEGGGNVVDTIPGMAKGWKARGQPWMIVADHNYGEGSARGHAALQPRFFGCNLIVARSIARIAETNLRKQGVLTLQFENEGDYLRIASGDAVETLNLTELLAPGAHISTQVRLRVTKFEADGTTPKETFELGTKHSLSPAHLDWIRAGSALNLIREKAAKAAAAGPASPAASFPGAGTNAGVGARAFGTWARAGRRGYATAAMSKPPSTSTNPNDSNYVPPAADSRTESIRRIGYPPADNVSATASTVPSPRDVHDTITRAWLLREREGRDALRNALSARRERVPETVVDLARESPDLPACARLSSSKHQLDEHDMLRRLDLLRDAPPPLRAYGTHAPPLSDPEARRKLKAVSGKRLHGLFPREMKTPTTEPAKTAWMAYVPSNEEQ